MPFKSIWLALALLPIASAAAAPAAVAPGAAPAAAGSTDTWTAQVPAIVDKPETWALLVPQLMERGMYYGARAAARDILNFSADLKSKEMSYDTLIKLIDLGYPFSIRSAFVAGDLEVNGRDNFAQSYLLYKGIVNLDKKMDRWAETYFAKLDKDHAPKYLLFKALQAYGNKQTPEAVQLLTKALAVTSGAPMVNLAKKIARTLARIHYESGDYVKSLEIYQTFLLKTDPVNPNDYLEAAWNLYRLKRFPEALGSLYNLESKGSGSTLSLEKYVLRGLIHREFCSSAAVDTLLKTFTKEFGATISGIKLGEPLASFPQLMRIEHPDAQEYRQYTQSVRELEAEAKKIRALTPPVRPLATYVYQAELAMLKRTMNYYADRALESQARQLVILGESLRFLKFDVARERFNPDRVFAEPPAEPEKLVDSTDDLNFRLHWLQWGDYWRDERLLYRSLVKSRCEH